MKNRNNTGLAKVAVQCSADTFFLNKHWFSVLTFVVKIDTFAKPENVSCQLGTTAPIIWGIIRFSITAYQKWWRIFPAIFAAWPVSQFGFFSQTSSARPPGLARVS